MALDRLFVQAKITLPALPFVGPQYRTSQLPKSGDPCVLGKLYGVALTDADSDGNTVTQKDGIFNLSVKAEGGAMAAGAKVYFDATDAVTALNDDAAEVFFGFTLDAIGNGLTKTVRVQVG